MGANDSFFFSMTHLAEGITNIFRREQPQDTIELKIPLSTADNILQGSMDRTVRAHFLFYWIQNYHKDLLKISISRIIQFRLHKYGSLPLEPIDHFSIPSMTHHYQWDMGMQDQNIHSTKPFQFLVDNSFAMNHIVRSSTNRICSRDRSNMAYHSDNHLKIQKISWKIEESLR